MKDSAVDHHSSDTGYGAIETVPFVGHDVSTTPTSSLARRTRIINPVTGAIALFVGIVVFAILGTNGGSLSVASTAQLVQGDKLVVGRHDEYFYGPYFYDDQVVDHLAQKGDKHFGKKWTQRYYVNSRYFGGPGSPIVMIIGGEGEATSLYYPYIYEYLAKEFNAYVIQFEHRFYGKSDPVNVEKNEDMIGLLTVENAMQDALRLLDVTRRQLKCSDDRTSKDYCPTMTVGASYPGFVSGLMRIVHPDKVDIAYASSAPLHLYSQDLNSNDYFDLVTRVAENASSGCAKAVKDLLFEVHSIILKSDDFYAEASKMNICTDTFPDYINTKEVFASELMTVVGQNFADFNMENYPPGDDTFLNRACHILQDETHDLYGRVDNFFDLVAELNGEEPNSCGFDLRIQIPAGRNATISTSDWTGAGFGKDGNSWDFHCCTELIIQTGFSDESMFYPKKWTLDWLIDHCQTRYGISPTPYKLVDDYGFDDLSEVSRIIFTNGLKDGWSESSIKESPNNNVVVINLPNGAHHSELSHLGPSEKDTDDIQASLVQIQNQLKKWFDEINAEKEI